MELENFCGFSDNHLFLLIKKGDQLAFNQVYDRYWRKLYSYTFNILNDVGYTEDTLQEVFINIWIKRGEIEIKSLKNYLFNSVRNNAISKLRKDNFLEIHESILENLFVSSEIEQNIDEDDLNKSIDIIIKRLPSRCRTIFQMSRYQDFSISEIANHFNISHRTVENQIHIALKHLRKTLGVFVF